MPKSISKNVIKDLQQSSSVKARVALFLIQGNEATLPELCKKVKAKPITVRTVLSDLRSRKYGIGQPLPVEREDDTYRVVVSLVDPEKQHRKAAKRAQVVRRTVTRKVSKTH